MSDAFNPFEAPTASSEDEHIPTIGSRHLAGVSGFRPLNGRASVTNVFLGITALIGLASTAIFVFRLTLLLRPKNGDGFPAEIVQISDSAAIGSQYLKLLFFVITSIPFCIWGYRAYANLEPLGAIGLNSSPGWAAGWFFVPVMNLARPHTVYTEIWKASDPAYLRWTPRVALNQRAGLINAWWALWLLEFLVPWFAGVIVGSSKTEQPTIDALLVPTVAMIVASLMMVAAGVLAILVVQGITARQNEKLARLTGKSAAESGFDMLEEV